MGTQRTLIDKTVLFRFLGTDMISVMSVPLLAARLHAQIPFPQTPFESRTFGKLHAAIPVIRKKRRFRKVNQGFFKSASFACHALIPSRHMEQ